jgi:hypothetical protein
MSTRQEKKLIEIQNKLLNDKPVFGLEATSKCNKSCYICPRDNFNRKDIDMTVKTFSKLLDWLPKECDVFFAGYGEPLMNENLVKFVNKFYERGNETSVMTNGKLLSIEKIKELFDNGLDRLQISIILKDGIDQVLKYTEMVPENNRKSKIEFNVLYEDDMTLPVDFAEKILEQGFKLCFKLIHNRGNELYSADWTHDIRSCGSFFILGDIDSGGNLKICSQDINGVHNMGDIFNMTFVEYKKFKKKFFGNRGITPICNHCTDEYRLIHLQNYDNGLYVS